MLKLFQPYHIAHCCIPRDLRFRPARFVSWPKQAASSGAVHTAGTPVNRLPFPVRNHGSARLPAYSSLTCWLAGNADESCNVGDTSGKFVIHPRHTAPTSQPIHFEWSSVITRIDSVIRSDPSPRIRDATRICAVSDIPYGL